jgi:putative membrane protein
VRLRIALMTMLAPVAALAHSGESLQPHDLWSAWEFDPGVVIPLLLSAILYFIGSRRQRIHAVREQACFWAGWFTLFVALISPLHPMGEVLFSAHMVQHELLMLVAAPLLVLARPAVTFLWGLPFEWRRTIGQAAKKRALRGAWSALTDPFTAWWIHAIAIWVWHVPFLFDRTLKSDAVHTAQHLSFFLSGLLFWWALFYTHGRMGYGAGVFYLFTTAVHTSILGALLTFAPHLWYAAYTTTTAVWGLSPLEDQQIGGLIMWVPGSVVYLVAGLALFAAWLRESDAVAERSRSAK